MIVYNSADFENKALSVLSTLRNAGINSEIWLDPTTKLEKQLKYADLKGISYMVIVGILENEPENQVVLKNLHQRTQETVEVSGIVGKLK
jgi:histidyl-tRNA synthetase